MDPDVLIREYLLLGLRFDRIEPGYVDAFTGDPRLRGIVEDETAPNPSQLARRAEELRRLIPSSLEPVRADFVAAHLRALECAGRKFAGEEVGFVEEVQAYFDVSIAKSDPQRYREAHERLDEALGGTDPLAERMQAYRLGDEIPPERLRECIDAFSSALRDRVRTTFPLPDGEVVEYEVVTDKPWSGFNYYLGGYRSRVAVNADIKQQMSNLPRLVAHESYPGHHTEHCRKEAGLVERSGQAEQTIFLGQHPAVPDGRGSRGLGVARGRRAGLGEMGRGDLRRSGTAVRRGACRSCRRRVRWSDRVRQDAALMLHDEHRDIDDVAAFLKRWLLVDDARARQMLRFVSSPLWRAYVSTYVEGYRLLRAWLDARPPGISLSTGSPACSTSRWSRRRCGRSWSASSLRPSNRSSVRSRMGTRSAG